MPGLMLRALFVLSIALGLASCGTRPKPMPEVQEIYEIRDAAVTANSGIPRALITGIATRMDKAIASTVRPAPLPRAVMNINVVRMESTVGLDGVRSETEVSVTLTDVPSGQALMVRNFLVYSFSIKQRGATESAAEAIAARLRVEYALAQPVVRKPKDPAPRLSTRMNDDTLVPIEKVKSEPVVIPLKTAPAIGADQDPILNSKTKVESAEPVVKPAPVKKETAGNAIEDGAKAKVVIAPKVTQPAADEPCVETMDKKC